MKIIKNTKKAFTLVELIVVITILAILASISYTSYQGYASDARNSKRQSDVRSIVSKINERTTVWMNVTNSVINNPNFEVSTWAGVTFWGDPTWTSYNNNIYTAWTINFLALWLDEITDPLSWESYSIWAVTRWWKRFEVAWVVETDNWNIAYVNWDYEARTLQEKEVDTFSTWDTTLVLLDSAWIVGSDNELWFWHFKVWDIVEASADDWTVTSWTSYTIRTISSDLSRITITPGINALDDWWQYIKLKVAESAWLITPNGSNNIIVDWWSDLPY